MFRSHVANALQWYIRPISNSGVILNLESGKFENLCSVLSILRVIDIQLVFVASKKAAAWRRGWFSGLLPDGLRAPRTGQDGHKCHEENKKQGGEKVGNLWMHTFQ